MILTEDCMQSRANAVALCSATELHPEILATPCLLAAWQAAFLVFKNKNKN